MDMAKAMSVLATVVMVAGCAREHTGAGDGRPDGCQFGYGVHARPAARQPHGVHGDSSMNRPVTLTVSNDKAELLTAGGIHYSLDRVSPNVYAGGNYIKIGADLSVRPKRLTVSSNDRACNWAATAP